MKNIRDCIKLFRFNMTYTILFEIILKAVSFAVLIPLYYTFINVAVKLSGITYLSKETVRKFFKAPSTYAFLFIMIFFAAMVIMVDVSGINYAYHRSNYLKKTSPIRMFLFGISSALRLLRPRNMPVFVTILTYIPVMGYVVLTFHFLNIRAPYIVDLVSINMRLTIACVGIYVILLFYSLRYTFIIHAYNIEQISFRKSIDRTKELLKGKRVKIIGGLILWCIVTIGIPAVVDHFYTGAFLKYIMKATGSIKATSMVYEAVKIVMSLLYVLLGLPLIYSFICNQYYSLIPAKEGKKRLEDFAEYDAKKSRRKEWSAFLVILSLAIIVDVGYYALQRFNVIHLDASYLEKVTITAHRGDCVSAPENTLAAFESAIEKGADVIELDVRQTKDGEIVVMHDENVKRTCGVSAKVGEMTFDEIRELSAGATFKGKGKNKNLYQDEKVPTLREVIELVGDRAKLNIELKPAKTDKKMEQAVVDIIREYNYYDNCIVASLTYRSIKKAKKADPKVKTIYVMAVAMGDFYDLEYADGFSIKYRFINNEVIKNAHKAGKEVYAWTIDDKKILESMMLLDVDSVITNDPDGIRRAMYDKYYGDTILEKFSTFLENQL